MSWAAVIAGGAALVGGAVSARSSKKAGEAAAGGADAAAREQARQFDIIQANQRPYQQIGTGALNQLAALYGLPQYDAAAEAADARQVGASTFRPSDIGALIQQGYSVDDILQVGMLAGNQGPGELAYLRGLGLSPEDINRLETGTFSPMTPGGGGAGPNGTLEGTVVGFGPGGQPIYGVSQGPGTGVTPAGGAGAPDYSSFYDSPDYRFALEQGQQAVERGAAARGNLYSGNTLAETTRFGQGLATQNYGRYVGQLNTLAGIGQQSVSDLTGAGLATGANVGNALITAGSNRASGIAGAGDAYGAAIGGVAGGLYDWWSNRNRPQASVPGGTTSRGRY